MVRGGKSLRGELLPPVSNRVTMTVEAALNGGLIGGMYLPGVDRQENVDFE